MYRAPSISKDRLQLVEDLWDSIAAEAAAEPGRLPVDSSLRQELRRRSEAYRSNPHEAIPLDEALGDIERKLEMRRPRGCQ